MTTWVQPITVANITADNSTTMSVDNIAVDDSTTISVARNHVTNIDVYSSEERPSTTVPGVILLPSSPYKALYDIVVVELASSKAVLRSTSSNVEEADVVSSTVHVIEADAPVVVDTIISVDDARDLRALEEFIRYAIRQRVIALRSL